MKLRTSFFNFRVLLKNLTRFAPLWILYAVGEVLGLMSLDLETEAFRIAGDLTYLMGPIAIFHAGYALLVAACLFGDLFDSRMCNGLHAMPMKREGWLLTNLMSGLVFALIPSVVGGGVAVLFLDKYWWMALVWQGTSLLQFVFFFGVAVFCAMCAGKRLGMIAIYAMVNFLSMLVYWAAHHIYEPLLSGVVLSDYWFAKLCPLISLMGSTYLDYITDNIMGGFFRGFIMESWYYLFICVGVGVVFMLLGWLLYRKRSLETAGDFISFRPMRIFFLLAYTLAAGVLLYSFGDFLGRYQDYGFLVVGVLIGWFTGWMLLERSVKVFIKKVLLGFVAFLLVFAGSMGLMLLDPFGIAAYIPRAEDVAVANLYLQSDVFYYAADEEWSGWHITDPDEIAWVQELHQSMLETTVGTGETGNRTYFQDRLKFKLGNLDVSGEGYITTHVSYRLENGRDIYRTYRIPKGSPTMEELKPFFSDPRSVFSVNDYQQVKDTVQGIVVYADGGDKYLEIDDDTKMQELLAAIEADCKAGNMVQHDYFHGYHASVAGVDVSWMAEWANGISTGTGTRGDHVIIYEDCVNTWAVLNTLSKN